MAHRIKGLLKVNMRVQDLPSTLALFREAFGAELIHDRGDDTIGEFVGATMRLGDLVIDFVAPTNPDGDLARGIQKRGEGLDSIAVEVENLDDTIAHLDAKGVRVVNRTEHHGNWIAFVHPRSARGLLLEMIERAPEPEAEA